MRNTTDVPTPEQLSTLAQVVRQVSRRRRLSPEDAEDFAQIVQVRLIEKNHDIFHRFSGRSSLSTYLQVVITRMLLDWRHSEYGKWRPSAAAVRLGEWAVALERLIHRDGCAAEQAVQRLAGAVGVPSLAELRHLVGRLPRRERRHRLPDSALDTARVEFGDPIEAGECRRRSRQIGIALATALRELPHDDRELIRERYLKERSVQTIARSHCLDPKKLYRRFDRILRFMRKSIMTRMPMDSCAAGTSSLLCGTPPYAGTLRGIPPEELSV